MSNGDPGDLQRWSRVLAVAKQQGRADLAEQAQQALDKLNAEATQRDLDPGVLASFAEGAASGASFGLGPLIARAVEPEAKGFQEQALRQHPIASTVGEVGGSLVTPGFGGFVKGLAKPGVTALERFGTGAAIGGAQSGLSALGNPNATPGSVLGQALVGGALGGLGMNRAARSGQRSIEAAEEYADRIARRGRDVSVAERIRPPVPAVTAAATEGTPEEMAVAKHLGLKVEQVRGRVGQAAMTPAARTPAATAAPEGTPVLVGQRRLLRKPEVQGYVRELSPAEARARVEARMADREPAFRRTTKGTSLPATGTGETATARAGQPSPRPLTSPEQQARTHATPGVKTAPAPSATEVYGPLTHPTEAAEGGALEPQVVGGRRYRQGHRPFVPETPEAGLAQVKERLARAGGAPVKRMADYTTEELQRLLHASEFDPSIPALAPSEFAAVRAELRRRLTGGL